jgi:cyclase
VSQAVRIPVIASGGAGRAQHFVQAFQEGEADAALAASIFHFDLSSISELKGKLRAAAIPVRFPC